MASSRPAGPKQLRRAASWTDGKYTCRLASLPSAANLFVIQELPVWDSVALPVLPPVRLILLTWGATALKDDDATNLFQKMLATLNLRLLFAPCLLVLLLPRLAPI